MAKIEPLAHRMRPATIDEIVGQTHLLGAQKPLRRMIHNQRLSSMIFYGPPGIGKTTIARAISGSLSIPFRALNGVMHGKKEIDAVIQEAQKENTTYCLYLDEIHRMTKTQVESLLPATEDGTIILIGSTTESVYHALPSGILSRCTVYELEPLTGEEIAAGLKRALSDREKGLGRYSVDMEEDVLFRLADSTGGDMRAALNALEAVVVAHAEENSEALVTITREMVEHAAASKHLGYNGKDSKYDQMSAFQKSIRGSDTDAALYYLGLLIESGDLISICRRLKIIAVEDISLAAPDTWSAVLAAVTFAEQTGFPEARIPLANAVILLCLSPKSNSAYKALDAVLADLRSGHVHPIPRHLRDAHYKGAAARGNGIGYQYPHDRPVGSFGGWVPQQYLPDALKGKQYYEPREAGREKPLKEIYEKLKNAQKEV